MKLARVGGAYAAVGEHDTAFSHRQARYALVIQTRWRNLVDTKRQLAWTSRFHAAMAAYSNKKVYSNFIGQEPESRYEAAYSSPTYARLQAIKQQIDPQNLFRRNVNIQPAAAH